MSTIFKILFVLSTAITLLSCASKEEDDDYSQVLSDLQRVANIVDKLSLPSGNDSSSTQKPKHTVEFKLSNRSSSSEIDNLEEYGFTDETGTYSATIKYFDTDGETPITQENAFHQGSYTSLQTSHFKNDKYESNFTLRETTTLNDDTLDIPNFTLEGSGEVNYYNDDLLLLAKSVTLHYTNDTGFNIQYDMTFMEDKYSFTLEATLTLDDVLEEKTDDLLVSGNIIDANGNSVGEFILNGDDSVIIKDRDGNIIQDAGN